VYLVTSVGDVNVMVRWIVCHSDWSGADRDVGHQRIAAGDDQDPPCRVIAVVLRHVDVLVRRVVEHRIRLRIIVAPERHVPDNRRPRDSVDMPYVDARCKHLLIRGIVREAVGSLAGTERDVIVAYGCPGYGSDERGDVEYDTAAIRWLDARLIHLLVCRIIGDLERVATERQGVRRRRP
jgi:hypothetical protein